MNCKKCGNIIYEGDMVCRNCGEPVQPVQPINNGVVQPQMQATPAPQAPVNNQVMGGNVAPGVVNPGMNPGMDVNAGMVNQGVVDNTPQVMPQVPMQEAQPMQPGTMPMSNQPQPMPMSQPVVDNGMNALNNNSPAPKNNMFMIIVIALVAIILGLGGFIGYKVISNNSNNKVEDKKDTDSKKDKDKDSKEDEDKDKNKDNDKDKDDDDDKVVADSNVYTISGYKFTVPKNIESKFEDGLLFVSDRISYYANFGLDYYNYDSVVANPNSLYDELRATGIVIGKYVEVEVKGRKFLCAQFSLDNTTGLFYITGMSSYYSAVGILVANTAEAYDKALEDIASIADSGNTSSNFAGGDEKIDLNLESLTKNKSEITGVEYKID